MTWKNDTVVIGFETRWGRVLWWKCIGFGRPCFQRQFYGGPADVFTWGPLWVERNWTGDQLAEWDAAHQA